LHCNGVDLGTMRRVLYELSCRTGYLVLAPEYPGYGTEAAQPVSATAAVQVAIKAYTALHRRLPLNLPLVVLGRSIGSGLAAQVAVARLPRPPTALVLVSAFRSVARAAPVGLRWAVPRRLLSTEAALLQVTAPTLLIHGALDEIIPFEHSEYLHATSPARLRELVRLRGAGHNDIDYDVLAQLVVRFVARARDLA